MLDTDAVNFSTFDHREYFYKFRHQRNKKIEFIARCHENHDSYFVAGDILLIMHPLVGRDEYIELP